MNGKTATAIAIVLLAASAASAGQSVNDHSPAVGEAAPDGAALIDPKEVHRSILEGEAFELPTGEGPVRVEATNRVQETITFSNGLGQPTVERPPNVWELDPLRDLRSVTC